MPEQLVTRGIMDEKECCVKNNQKIVTFLSPLIRYKTFTFTPDKQEHNDK